MELIYNTLGKTVSETLDINSIHTRLTDRKTSLFYSLRHKSVLGTNEQQDETYKKSRRTHSENTPTYSDWAGVPQQTTTSCRAESHKTHDQARNFQIL
jgi:hypothetical protein